MARRFHQVPTHISTPEPVLSVGPLSLTAKQFLLLLLGCALSYHFWQLLDWLASPAEQILRVALAALPVLVAAAVAFVRLADRPLEQWGLVLLRYWRKPRLLLWRSLRYDPDHLHKMVDENTAAHPRHTFGSQIR